MISVCIPIYNYDVTKLVKLLSAQANVSNILIEFILIDDSSLEKFRKVNSNIEIVNQYIQMNKNIGRSKIRNKFKEYAKYQYLLFLDCDSGIIEDDFLLNYVNKIDQNKFVKVICGGRIYNKENKDRTIRLRWKYGKFNESQSLNVRKEFPNNSFMTNNFIIKKEVFDFVSFDERLSLYGHEDTIFGLELKSNNIIVEHINNHVIDQYIEPNDIYLKKIDESILNLVQINDTYDDVFLNEIKLLRSYNFVKRNRMLFLVKIYHFTFSKLSVLFFKKGFIVLKMLSLYKLGLFIKLNQNWAQKEKNKSFGV